VIVGTSRAPIREALKILNAQGILVEDANQGFRVASFNEKTILQILKARLSIEIILLEDAINNWQEEDPDILGLKASINEMHLAAVDNDAIASMEADLRFHKYIADSSKNTIASTLWDAIARHVMIILSLNKFRPADLHAVVTHHNKLRDIIIGQVRNGLHVETLRLGLESHFLKVWRSQKSELWSSKTKL
jgi:DNA-binding GntR family transcriptional regulator